MKISVCIATYRRNEQLAALLDDLVGQSMPPDEVVVVDNTASGGALEVVERRRRHAPFPIHYGIQPAQNISLTRNRTIELAEGDWLVFVDDDERLPRRWLVRLIGAAERWGADAVLGPVVPILPRNAPEWIKRGRFYDWPRMRTGLLVPRNRLRFGNVAIRAPLLRQDGYRFDPACGLTGGEDGDLLARLAQAGARIVWCDEATVTEPVEAARLSLHWLAMRAMRGGQNFARHTLAGRYGPATLGRRVRLAARSMTQLLLAAALALATVPLGRHRAAFWSIKAAANFGKLSALWGSRYEEYARRAAP